MANGATRETGSAADCANSSSRSRVDVVRARRMRDDESQFLQHDVQKMIGMRAARPACLPGRGAGHQVRRQHLSGNANDACREESARAPASRAYRAGHRPSSGCAETPPRPLVRIESMFWRQSALPSARCAARAAASRRGARRRPLLRLAADRASARPTGDSFEISPWAGLASMAPTMV